jgi:hypothetical protein
MEAKPLSENVRRLLEELGGVVEMETLVLLAGSARRNWSAVQVAAALGLDQPPTSALERLAHLNLVDVTLAHEVLYKYSPTSPELSSVAAELAREYAERRLLVLKTLEGSSSAARAFADAFRIRRRK